MRLINYVPWRQTNSRDGVQPDDRKVQAIHEMTRPETKEDVKGALGVRKYLARFMPHQSANSKALRSLFKEKQHGNGLLNTKKSGTRSKQL